MVTLLFPDFSFHPPIFYWKPLIPNWYWCSSETTTKAHSKLTQTFNMELFAKVVNCWELTNFTKSSIVDVWLAKEYVSVLVPFVTKKGPERSLTGNFSSSLCVRKKDSSVISYIYFFHSDTSTNICSNTYSLLLQYWSTILSVSLCIFQPHSYS